MKMKKERIFDYAGDLKVEVEEIRRMESETKEQDSGSTYTRQCDAFLTILCC